MRYSIPMAEILDALCTAVDDARQALDMRLDLDADDLGKWRGKINDAWDMLLALDTITLAVWPNGKTVLELASRSEAGLTYHVDARHCQCRGAAHVCAHRVAAQLVRRALEAIGSTERQAA